MFAHRKIQKPDDFFLTLSQRKSREVYFYRINSYSQEVDSFIRRYYEEARTSGVILEGKIPNPDEKNLAYYEEMMGMDFRMEPGFISDSLKKWLPRMNGRQREHVTSSLYDSLVKLKQAGKNINMLKNAYIKFMCWLYYRFERIVNQLGEEKVPKILYEGEVSSYELMILSILAHAGCDIVLLQYRGDQSYLRLDPDSSCSEALVVANGRDFPEYFHLRWLREEMQNEWNRERMYGGKPQLTNCTNAWIEGSGLSDVRKSILERGNDPQLFYNCFCRIDGAADKLTYLNELFLFQQELKNEKRRVVIADSPLPRPTMEEIGAIRRKNYTRQEQMIEDLSANIQVSERALQQVLVKSFVDVMLAEARNPKVSLNRLTNKGVYLLCWFRRYQKELFSGWRQPEISCFLYMGGCRDEHESLFFRFLARTPVDVVILCPNRNQPCCLTDDLLYEIHYEDSLEVHGYPRENANLQLGTAAYHAERELDTMMYQDSGLYRNQQYGKANALTLKTMYEEIALLWKEELKYRPNFSTVDDVVNMPVLFAKVSGVKDEQVSRYWAAVKELVTEDTFVISKVPYLEPTTANPMKAYAAEFFKNGRLKRDRIKTHAQYPYGHLREETQEHMLDKLQLLIEQKTIQGTFENGTEYGIIALVLNLPKELVRLIQRFDFTRKNPKLIYINTTETMISKEDAILTAYLNLVGFDILFLVPTGYQSVERYFNRRIMEEHQIGEYMYDLRVPNLAHPSPGTRPRWRDIILKRGT